MQTRIKMKTLKETLIEDVKMAVDAALENQVDSNVLEKVAGALYGPAQPLVQNDPSSTQVSTGIDAIVGQLSDFIRSELHSRLR